MARVKILLVTMFVLTLFIMCGGCGRERHEQRDDGWRNRQSEREQLERREEQERRERHAEQERLERQEERR